MKWLIASTIAVVCAAAGYTAYPYYTLNRIERALVDRDAATLEALVDWPKIRADLKAEWAADALTRASREGGGAMLGTALGAALADKMIDALVNPVALLRMAGDNKDDKERRLSEFVASRGFITPTTFRVEFRPPSDEPLARLSGTATKPLAVTAIMEFGGSSWRVTKLILPVGEIQASTTSPDGILDAIRQRAQTAPSTGEPAASTAQRAQPIESNVSPRPLSQAAIDLLRVENEKRSSASKTAWQVSEERSKIDDSKNVFLQLSSSEPIKNQYGQNANLDLMIACRESKTSLYIVFGGHFMSSLNDSGMVTYRIDKRPAARRPFRESSDHTALGLWSSTEAVPFIKDLFGGTNLFVRAIPYSQSAVSGEFNISGIAEAISPLRAACRWPDTPPARGASK